MKLKSLLTDILTEEKKNIPNSLDGTFYLEYFIADTEKGYDYEDYEVEIKRPGEKVGNIFSKKINIFVYKIKTGNFVLVQS